jgi:hypothetical protein
LNAELRRWTWEVSNQRVHGTTHEHVARRWTEEKPKLHPIAGRPPYAYVEEELRKVARDAFVSWEGNRYSVPWTYAGQPVWVRDRAGQVEVHYGGQRVAVHSRVFGKHHIVRLPEHHQGIPLGSPSSSKILIHVRQTAPVVEIRSLAAYESAAGGVQ